MVLPQVCPDTASFAAAYESISLRLDKLTPEQSRVSLFASSVFTYICVAFTQLLVCWLSYCMAAGAGRDLRAQVCPPEGVGW